MSGMSTRVILCPGQGAQVVGMGRAWAERSAEARAVFDRADAVLGTRLGVKLSDLCFAGPAERLNQTDAAQPALFVAGVACWRGLLSAWGAGGEAGAVEAHLLAAAGLSLGEYTALHVAGALDFDAGLELVALRGRAMQDAADAIRLADGTPGSGMVAIIGGDEAQVNALCDAARGGDVLVPANFNAPGQIVISGSIAACHRAVEAAGTMGLRATLLQVAGAFHSPLMAPAAERLEKALATVTIRPPRCVVASNVGGATFHPVAGGSGGAGDAAGSIRRSLVRQLTAPVRWAENCAAMLAYVQKSGGGGGVGVELHELAPGKTLAGLMRRIDKTAKVETHDEP